MDYLQVEGAVVPILQTIANVSIVFEYNLPAVILFFRRFSDRYKRLSSAEVQILQQSYVKLLEQTRGQSRLDPTVSALRKELADLLSLVLKREDITEEIKESISSLKNKQDTLEGKLKRRNTVGHDLTKRGQFRLLVGSTSGSQSVHLEEIAETDTVNCQVNRDSVSYSRC